MTLKILEKPCVLQVLKFLTQNPGAMYTELKNSIEGADATIKKAVDHLISIGLVREIREDKFPRRRLLYPTEKGREIGELLQKIEEILVK